MDVLLVSCYELGHQPIATASAAAFLDRAGFSVKTVDLAVEPASRLADFPDARLVAISTPMHTALHVGVRAAELVAETAPTAHRCFFGLYALLNAKQLLGGPAHSVIGGECEQPLTELALAIERGDEPVVSGVVLPGLPARAHLARLDFTAPLRQGLPPIERYAHLDNGGERIAAGAVEASRGCLHRCRHCPIPPVYGGRFFVVPREIVLDDIGRLVKAGAGHITFADPDFLNGPRHALALVREMATLHDGLTFDITTKVELLLRHRRLLPELQRAGCLFVVSAVESLSDIVLAHLDKGHTRADVFEALALVRGAGLALRPSLMPFTPWATLDDYFDLLDWIEDEALTDHVDPVQLSIRLLVPPGSLLADSPAMVPHLRGLDARRFYWLWSHPDPRMDRLQQVVSGIVREAAQRDEPAGATFRRIRQGADELRGSPRRPAATELPARAIAAAPRLTEPWFC